MAASVPAESSSTYRPFVPPEESPPEFTLGAILTGTFLGLIFAASSLYLVLKVGMTVSASIPVAVLAITLFRALSKAFGLRPATILENNITQTAGSAGESIAFGVGVTMPALLLLGFGIDPLRVMVVAVLGGLLGILAMIPLRRAFIVNLHGRPGEPGKLLYPEGVAAAQVLISGEKGGTTGLTVFLGFGLAFAHKFITEGMGLLVATLKLPLLFINRAAAFAAEMAPELLGVGYIIGVRTSAVMMAGAVLGYLVIIPALYYVGEYANVPVPPSTEKLIRDMSTSDLRDNYLLYIGAGCVAAAGIFSMFRTLPMILRSAMGLAGLGQARASSGDAHRTDRDLPMTVVWLGSLGLIVLLALFLAAEVGWMSAVLGAVLVVLFGFLFTTVSARLTGEIGSSSNPISGMTVATLMLTCLIFLAMSMTSSTERVLALSVAAVVCVAASNGGTTAQSLKTGFLVGGTPWAMQLAILVGALISALVIGYTLIAMNQAGTVYSSKPENLPEMVLTADEMALLKQTEVYEGRTFKVWDTRNDDLPPDERPVKKGRYLIDPDTGRVAFLVDPAIMGRLRQRDNGSPVNREFDAPKTQVMGIIINGVLEGRLNWSMVAIGAMIAVMLELCGVSALAFAVGVYVPIQYSVPIFLGGLVRWLIDSRQARQNAAALAAAGDDPEARARAEIDAIRRAETSPGVLLASGYIAGGSIAGVLLAFTAFSDELPRNLRQWEHRTIEPGVGLPLKQQSSFVAYKAFSLRPDEVDDPQIKRQIAAYAEEVAELNKDLPKQYVAVPSGTNVALPQGKSYTAEHDMTLGEVAQATLGRADSAGELYGLNEKTLSLPETLPANVPLKVPSDDWPALLAFASLIAILIGIGWWGLAGRNGSGSG
jgi:putative OPT family oligopeptide transporter